MITFYKRKGFYYPCVENNALNNRNKSSSNSIFNLCCFCKFSGEFYEDFSVSKENCPIYKARLNKSITNQDSKEEIKILFPKKDCIATHNLDNIKKFVIKHVDEGAKGEYEKYINKENLEKEREYFNTLTDITKVKEGGYFNPCNFCDHLLYVINKIKSEKSKDIEAKIKSNPNPYHRGFSITPENCPFFKAEVIEKIYTLSSLFSDCYWLQNLNDEQYPYNKIQEIIDLVNKSKYDAHYWTSFNNDNIVEIEDILPF